MLEKKLFLLTILKLDGALFMFSFKRTRTTIAILQMQLVAFGFYTEKIFGGHFEKKMGGAKLKLK